jgi:hypothetical protein
MEYRPKTNAAGHAKGRSHTRWRRLSEEGEYDDVKNELEF